MFYLMAKGKSIFLFLEFFNGVSFGMIAILQGRSYTQEHVFALLCLGILSFVIFFFEREELGREHRKLGGQEGKEDREGAQ